MHGETGLARCMGKNKKQLHAYCFGKVWWPGFSVKQVVNLGLGGGSCARSCASCAGSSTGPGPFCLESFMSIASPFSPTLSMALHYVVWGLLPIQDPGCRFILRPDPPILGSAPDPWILHVLCAVLLRRSCARGRAGTLFAPDIRTSNYSKCCLMRVLCVSYATSYAHSKCLMRLMRVLCRFFVALICFLLNTVYIYRTG